MKNSTAPARNWLSVSVSDPNWLLGNTASSKRPPVSRRMFCAASLARRFMGCAGGRLLAYLYRYCGAASVRWNGAMARSAPPPAALMSLRRVVFMLSPWL
ncbi:hypothetical protein D3C78_1678240 [compost metagenome]